MSDTDKIIGFAKGLKLNNEEFLEFIQNTEYSEKTLENYQQYMQKATSATSLFSSTLKSMAANIGIMLAINLAVKGISLLIGEVDKYINRLDIARDALSETEGELDSVDSKIANIGAQIKELESMGTLSLTDKEELERLREENRELAIRKKYLEDIKAQESEDVVRYAKEKMDYKYGDTTSREDIDAYKQYMENPDAYYGGQYYESDALTIKLAQYERYQELKQQAVEDEDWESIERLDKELQQLEASLIEDRTELQGFKDDLSLTGESSAELDNVNQKLKFIDDLLLTPSENLKNFLNSDAITDDVSKLKELASNGELTEEKFKQSFSAINSYLEENNLSFEDLISTLEIYRDELNNTTQASTKFTKTQMIDTINSMADGFDVLDDIYADVLDGGTFDFTKLDTSKFSEAFSEITPEYEKFIETVSASPTDIEACQGAFNDLVSAFIDSKGILEGVDEETKQLTIDMLENMGVVNAEEVVTETLAQKKRNLAIETEVARLEAERFAFATLSEVNALINVEDGVSVAEIALARYTLEKMKTNGIVIDESSDIEEILKLGEAALLSAECMAELSRAKVVLGAVEKANGDLESAGVAMWEYTDALNTVDKLNSGTYEFKTTAIDLTSVLSNYGGATKTAAAANKNLKNATDASNDALKAQKEQLEKNKEALEETKSEYEELYDAIQWFYDKQIEKQETAIENLEKEIDLIQSQIDIYDGALSAIDRFYEKQIEELEKKKDALSGNNKEVEAAINLEKRQQELLEARSKKTIGLYSKDKGIGYVTDTSAIKTAEENLAEAQRQKDEADIDAQINKLKEYQKLWAEIPNVKEKAEQDSQMIQLLGAEWESILLEGRIQNITSFKDQYIGLQQQIDNNESMIASYEEKIAYYESLKTEWDNLLNKYTEDTYTQLLIGAFGNDFENELLNGRTGRWTQFAEDYYNIQVQLKEVTDQIESLAKRMEEYASRIESAANSAVNAVKKLKEAESSVSSSSAKLQTPSTTTWTAFDKADMVTRISGKAKGGIVTKRDAGDLDFIAKDLGEDHTMVLQEGEAVIPKENVAKNPEVVQSLIDGEPLKTITPEPILANKKQLELEAYWNAMESSGMFFESPKQYAPKLRNDIASNIVNNNQQQTTVQINGDLSFPNIKSGNDAELLLNDLSNMANKARQRSARR